MMGNRTRQLSLAAGAGFLLASHLFVFMPANVYLGNPDEFTTSLWAVLGHFARPMVFVVALTALVGALLPARLCARFLSLSVMLSVVFWIQGNVLVWDYGLLDGTAIDWDAHPWRSGIELIIWSCMLVAAALATPGLARAISFGAVGIFSATLLTTSVSVISAQDISLGTGSGAGERGETLPQMYRFSSSRNVLHIVADGLQSDILAAVLANGEDGRRLSRALEGFVLFDNHLGAFPYTHMSVPAILSGRIYRNEVPREQFLNNALGPGKATILNAASAIGFDVDLAVTTGLEKLYARGSFTHLYPLGSNLHVSAREFALNDSATLFDLSLFRVMPHILKRHVYRDQRWLAQDFLTTGGSIGMRSFAHAAFLRRMSEEMRADRERPVYKLLHVMTSHNPMATNERCEYAGRVLPTVRETVTTQARCNLLEIAAVLESMKELGIFDAATVVLMGDHGAWIPPVDMIGLPGANTQNWIVDPVALSMAIPAFAIKTPGAKGPIRVSKAPSWIVDTAPTIAAAAGITGNFSGTNALNLSESEARERRFHIYRYQRGEWDSEYLSPIEEFSVHGAVKDQSSWHRGVTHNPGGRER